MQKLLVFLLITISVPVFANGANDQEEVTAKENSEGIVVEHDVVMDGSKEIKLFFVGHGTLYIQYNGKTIHIDPVMQEGDYSSFPKADLILITHAHPDHLDTAAIEAISTAETEIILNPDSYKSLQKGTVMKNGEIHETLGISIAAVPAYNYSAGKEMFHPKDRDNGYVLTMGSKTIYIAGDTENIPEMADLPKIDIAFLPMNQPYTMLPEQVRDAALVLNPDILYPYHFGDTNTQLLVDLLQNESIDVRIRSME